MKVGLSKRDVSRCLERALAFSRALNAIVWLSEGGYASEPRLAMERALGEARRNPNLKLLAKVLAILATITGAVVDIGCGSGFVARYLRCLGLPTYVVCIDSDEAMARVSRDACDDFVVARGEYLPIRCCDAVCVSIGATHEMLSEALRELPRCRYVAIADTFTILPIPTTLRDLLAKYIPNLTRYRVEIPIPLSKVTKILEKLGLGTITVLKRGKGLFTEATIIARRPSKPIDTPRYYPKGPQRP